MNDYDKLVELYKNGGNIREAISDRKERNSFLKRLRDEGINENNRLKEDFRKIIAMRDGNGVSRAQISQELNINYNTIKTACSKYGSAVKKLQKSTCARFLANTYSSLSVRLTKFCFSNCKIYAGKRPNSPRPIIPRSSCSLTLSPICCFL